MTREEAIHIVNVAFSVPQATRRAGENRTYFEDEIREAKEMAIKALDQDPCGDAIRRQAVLDIVNNPLNIRLDEIIKKLPPVTPQPKTGHWIRHDNGKYHWYLCSCCDAMAGSDEQMMAYRYCPNCGARMEDKE